MHIRCPQCSIPVEIVDGDAITHDLSCPSCGVSIQKTLWVDETRTYRPGSLQRVAHFELQECLGRGAFGTVWKARDTQLERFVAIKLPRQDQFDDSTFESFVREARAAAQVKHPHIVAVHEIGRDDETVYIASEFIEGVSLKDRLQVRQYSPTQAAALVAMVADALHAAHTVGVIHRDMKPANILIDSHDKPHLTDFGLAKRESAEMTVTTDGQILGTVAYMPPEQARGTSHLADGRSDVYSLGVILYELLCRRRPFQEGRSRLLLHQIQHDDPEPLRKHNRQTPRDLETICLKALQKEPSRRYATAHEFAQDLQRFLRGEPIHARPVSRAERAWRWCRRNPALASAVGVAILASGLVAGMLFTAREPAPLSTVLVQTNPVGATIVLHPLDPMTGEPLTQQTLHPTGVSPLRVDLTPGNYLAVAVLDRDGFGFHEVMRRVPDGQTRMIPFNHASWEVTANGTIVWPMIEIPPASVTDGMAQFEGSENFTIGSDSDSTIPKHNRSVPGFWLDPAEVTVAQLRAALPAHPAFIWYQQHQMAPQESDAVAFISWDEAASYAEKIGKRLPEEWEFEFAATFGGTRRFPWGDDAERITSWEFGTAGEPVWDQLPTEPPVRGLFSNVTEWTNSWPNVYPAHLAAGLPPPENPSEHRVVRGAPRGVETDAPTPQDFLSADPRGRIVFPRTTWTRSIGLRCARSLRPRVEAEAFSNGAELTELSVSLATQQNDIELAKLTVDSSFNCNLMPVTTKRISQHVCRSASDLIANSHRHFRLARAWWRKMSWVQL